MTHFYIDIAFPAVDPSAVSMPSRADDSFLQERFYVNDETGVVNCVNALSGWWLISTQIREDYVVEVFLEVSMPSRADDSFLLYTTPEYSKEMDVIVSMPSRADDSFLRYPFKNLSFMRFSEPIFAGICQNILTGPLFRACLQFGHI